MRPMKIYTNEKLAMQYMKQKHIQRHKYANFSGYLGCKAIQAMYSTTGEWVMVT